VEDPEEVLGVLVDLRPLALREDVLEVERMPAEALREPGRLVGGGRVEVNPGQPSVGELGRRGSADRTASAAARGRCRLMRGRLGTGTEGVVGQNKCCLPHIYPPPRDLTQ
jgi:hypothetical protein